MKCVCGQVLLYALGILLLLSSCAGRRQVFQASEPSVQRVQVEMRASSFDFTPDVIMAKKGDTLVLHVSNVSGIGHN